MTQYTIFGIKNFLSKNGTNITILYVVYDDKTVQGNATEKFFITSDLVPSDLNIGDAIHVFYGARGSNGFLAGVQKI